MTWLRQKLKMVRVYKHDYEAYTGPCPRWRLVWAFVWFSGTPPIDRMKF